MPRLKNWPSRFAALVESARARPFEWGAHDCCLWAASGVLALTGADPARSWRGTYSTAREGLAHLRSLGGLEGAGALTGVPSPLVIVAIGDVGLVRWTCGTKSLALFSGYDWMAAGDSGLIRIPRDAVSKVWGVGRE